MGGRERIAVVHCQLEPNGSGGPASDRYIPLSEFELWKHLMETKHFRQVEVISVSIWIAEDPAQWNSGFLPGDLEPVVRVCFETRGTLGLPVRVVRFLPANEYPRAQEALLSHFREQGGCQDMQATPGYFVPREFCPSV